ncbi:uncharacterized protein LOC117894805 [Drosophila subobscura]|uniref:uncharacterized protein LOC117894805 n=1 Tax=Drosophila subobscura TaxID=7241 RepID=UPI00155ADFB7|nr:uncharacterized protein LOC117894805 [Drosophila subobscura]
MHHFIWTTIVGLLALASAANVPRLRSDYEQSRTEVRAGRRYQEQDTARAFYSYGYSDDTAARAEYSSRDGSSRGFYSYVDADGKLQTVRYEASRGQGFKAEGSSLPQAPVDEGKPPLPVADTEEVQQARSAHLNALREAREESDRTQQEGRARANANEAEERNLSDEDADILERVRAQLSAMLADRQRSSNLPQINEATEDERQTAAEDQRKGDREAEEDARLRTVYSLGDLSSSSYLKLGDLQDRLSLRSGDLRVPVGAYYTLVSPSAQYSVTTPTELRTLRPVALSRSLLVSKRN